MKYQFFALIFCLCTVFFAEADVNKGTSEVEAWNASALTLINSERYADAAPLLIKSLALDRGLSNQARDLLVQLGTKNAETMQQLIEQQLNDKQLTKKDELYWNEMLELLHSNDEFPDEDHSLPETSPEYPDGHEALLSIIYKQTGWREEMPPVKVHVDCLIDEEGHVADAQVTRTQNEYLNDAATQLCMKLDTFTPALHHGKPVKAWYQIIVVFPQNYQPKDK